MVSIGRSRFAVIVEHLGRLGERDHRPQALAAKGRDQTMIGDLRDHLNDDDRLAVEPAFDRISSLTRSMP
jgi:hypothetical protein